MLYKYSVNFVLRTVFCAGTGLYDSIDLNTGYPNPLLYYTKGHYMDRAGCNSCDIMKK